MGNPEVSKSKISNRKVVTSLVIGIVSIIVISIGLIRYDNDNLSQPAIVAKEYLEEKGFNIVSYEGAGDNYLLTESLVRRFLKNYFGKCKMFIYPIILVNIHTENFSM